MAHCPDCGAEQGPEHFCNKEALRPGDMVGEYRVEKKLGEGGMGAVFAGVHPRIGKKVAIKVLNTAMASNPEIVIRFENEARAVNAIGNRNIVDIFSFGTLEDGTPYFVMEWLVGLDLDQHLQTQSRMSLDAVMPIFRQVCRALAAAHEKDIVHRDLKPENIFLTPEPDGTHFVKLLDFGIAKFHGDEAAETKTRAGSLMGTPHFMSPEQALGQAIDHRTDIYAMAIMLYRMICGRYPFEGPPMVIISAHLSTMPDPPREFAPDISDELEEILLKNLAKDPNDRHQSITAFLEALEEVGPARPVATVMPTLIGSDEQPPPAAEVDPPKKIGGKGLAIAGVALALGIGGGIFALKGGGKDKAPPSQGEGPTPSAANPVAPLLELPQLKGFKRDSEYLPSPSASQSK